MQPNTFTTREYKGKIDVRILEKIYVVSDTDPKPTEK